MADIQVTRINRLENGHTLLEPLLEGPPTSGSAMLLPALGWLAAPTVRARARNAAALPGGARSDAAVPDGLHLSADQTRWLQRVCRAFVAMDPRAVDWLVGAAGGIDSVRRGFRERLDLELPEVSHWSQVCCTATEIAKVYAVLENLAEEGRQIPRMMQEFTGRSHEPSTRKLRHTWAAMTGQPEAAVHAAIRGGVNSIGGQVFAGLTITGPRSGLVVIAHQKLTLGALERFGGSPTGRERSAMVSDLVTPLIVTGIQIAAERSAA